MDKIDITAISLNNRKIVAKKTAAKAKNYAPKHKKGELFLCGPIPWNWLTFASNATGKGSALQVALGIWFLSGLNHKAATIKLTRKTLKQLGVERNAGYRGLRVLEESGLITVIRKPGSSPIVTIVESAAVEKIMDLANTGISNCESVNDAILSRGTSINQPIQNIAQNQVIIAEDPKTNSHRFRLNTKLEAINQPDLQEDPGINMSDGIAIILARDKSISEQSSLHHSLISVAETEACSP